MFLNLSHRSLDVCNVARLLIGECYRVTSKFPSDEHFALTQQIRRAAVSTYLNLSEGCSRKSEQERKRFLEISRGSIVEIDSAFDIAVDLCLCSPDELELIGNYLQRCFAMLSK